MIAADPERPSAMQSPLPASSRVILAVVAVVLAAGFGPAAAADKARTPAAKKADAILTPEQLRDCLTQQGRRDKATDAALKVKSEIAAEKAAVDRSGTELSEGAASLDRTSEDAVNAYNAKVDERNRRIDAYEQRVAAYNKDAEALQTMNDAFVKSCGNRRYDERDLADIQRKKK